MPLSKLLLFSSLFLGLPCQAATVAVIDSGIDTDHEALKENIWHNPVDSSFDIIDQDGNGLVDDVFGWNFVKNNNFLIDISQAGLLTEDIKMFFSIQTKMLKGEASEEEKAWIDEKKSDQDFVAALSQFGAFAHGTHVAGIVKSHNAGSKVLTVTLIPTKNPLEGLKGKVVKAQEEGQEPHIIVKYIIKGGLSLFAQFQGSLFTPIGKYLAEKQVAVANGSFGMGVEQAKGLVRPLLTLAVGNKPPSEVSVEELALFLVERVVEAQATLVKSAPDTLFVFAAGNDAKNNDEYPVAPANIKHPHVISVAALLADGTLASFSNFGQAVDIGALGVGVKSLTPRGPMIEMSGTSQAAPMVSGVASALVDINPSLKAADLKLILTGTAEMNRILEGRVKYGVMNSLKAQKAAELSKTLPLYEAIAQAKADESLDLKFSETFMPSEKAPFIDFMPSLLR